MYNLEKVASWWTTLTDKGGLVYDNLFISYENNVIAFLPFKRFKNYTYCEVKDEYVITHSKNVEYLTLLLKLKEKRQHIVKFAA